MSLFFFSVQSGQNERETANKNTKKLVKRVKKNIKQHLSCSSGNDNVCF